MRAEGCETAAEQSTRRTTNSALSHTSKPCVPSAHCIYFLFKPRGGGGLA